MPQQKQDEWEDVEWEDVEEPSTTITPPVTRGGPTQEPSMLSRAWSAVSEPLTTLPSKIASVGADWLDTPSLERSPTMARIQGFGAGALQGIGDLVSGLSSPINLGTAALTGGTSLAAKAGLPTIAKGLSLGAKAAGGATATHGASNVFDPESTLGERGFGLAEMAGGIAGMRTSPKTIQTTKKGNIFEATPPVPPVTPTPTQSAKIWLKNPTPEKVKLAAEQGYKFGGTVRDDGAFQMIKAETPPEVPILESEIGGARPTRAGALKHQLGPVADVKKQSAIAEAINFPRGVMASWDFSAPLRQGLPLIGKKAWWTSFNDMFRSWGNENAFQAVQKSIADKPLFRPRVGTGGKLMPSFADDAGLKLTDLTDLSKREEALMSTWSESGPPIPTKAGKLVQGAYAKTVGAGVRRSNRAYVAFLNKLRADTFEDLIKQGKVFGADGEVNLPLAREIANFVNTSTGRGSLGSLEQSAVALNSAFFSPRLIASRLQMLNPHYYWSASPMVRKEALKALFSVAAVGTTIGQLGRMAGGSVEADPTSSDFGKIKVGNTRIDPFAGFQQYVVLANRLMQGRTKSSITGAEYNLGEKFGRPTRLDVLGRFGEGKLHPVLTFATGLLRGKDFTGQPFNVPQELANRVMPIIVQDIIELAQEDPKLLPLAIPASLGMGIQSYESQ